MSPDPRRISPAPLPHGVDIEQVGAALGLDLDAFYERIVRLIKDCRALHAAVADRDRTIESLRAEVARMQRRDEERVREIDALSATVASRSPDVSTTADLGHQELAGRFQTFAGQDIAGLAQSLGNRAGSAAQRRLRLAELTRNILRLLLIDSVDDPLRLLDRLQAPVDDPSLVETAARICRIADELHSSAGSLTDASWLFDVEPGASIDPSYQEPWGGCDADASIEFAVLPGYRVGERVYLHQQVFTRIDPPGVTPGDGY